MKNHGNLGASRGKALLGVDIDEPGGGFEAPIRLAGRSGSRGVEHDSAADSRSLACLREPYDRPLALDLRKFQRQRKPRSRGIGSNWLGRGLAWGLSGSLAEGGAGRDDGEGE